MLRQAKDIRSIIILENLFCYLNFLCFGETTEDNSHVGAHDRFEKWIKVTPEGLWASPKKDLPVEERDS